MYDIKRDNYGLTYYELRDFIRQNIERKKFELIINDEVILQEFLSKGILSAYYSENEIFVRFKFNCFFQYFLMKNMDIDPEFKAFVLQEENFLYFTEEIDYYTGLKRDQADILELLTKRMNGAFDELITKIEEWKYGFDTIFETKRSIASTLDSSFVTKVTNHDNPKEEDLDQMHDNMLDSVKPDTGIEKKEDPITNLDTLWRHWVLTAKVLKNTEETDFENLKSNAFDSVITCSMAFVTLYKFLLKEHLRTHKDNVPEYLTVINRLLPLAHQNATYSFMGTAKLLVVIQEKIEKEIRDERVSDLQKFLSVFLYADLKGKDYHKYIKLFMSTVKRSYMYDMVLLKILNYYYMRSSTKQTDSVYENLIADVIVDSKGKPKNEKGKIIHNYRLMRHKTLNEEEGGLIS